MFQGSTDSNGVLDVSVKYEAVHLSGGKSKEDSQHVNITVSILRAAGLKVGRAIQLGDNWEYLSGRKLLRNCGKLEKLSMVVPKPRNS